MHTIRLDQLPGKGLGIKPRRSATKKIRKFSGMQPAVVFATNRNAHLLSAVEHALTCAQHMIHATLQSTVEQAELSVTIVTAAFTRLQQLS